MPDSVMLVAGRLLADYVNVVSDWGTFTIKYILPVRHANKPGGTGILLVWQPKFTPSIALNQKYISLIQQTVEIVSELKVIW